MSFNSKTDLQFVSFVGFNIEETFGSSNKKISIGLNLLLNIFITV